MMNRVSVTKSPVPIMWVDTSVILNLAKLKVGRNLSERDAVRLNSIQDRIQNLVEQGKLICPEADQQSEYLRTDSLFTEVFDQFSHGVRVTPSCMVEFNNIVKVMQAYVSNMPIRYSYMDAFASDPVPERVLDPFCQKYRVRLTKTWTQQDIEELTQSRNAICFDYERLRKQNTEQRITFEQQLRRELYDASTIRFREAWIFANKMICSIEPTLKEFSYWNEAQMLLKAWEGIATRAGFKGNQGDFFHSAHYHSIPSINISAQLSAHLLTRSAPIRRGDHMDIQHISAFLPYADIMIVDREMKNCVTQL